MDLRALAMGLAFSLMWSSAFATARIIVAGAPPLWSLALRFLISGALAMILARAMGQRLRLDRSQAMAMIVFGLCQNALYLGLNFVALQQIEAALAAIIASSMPLMVAGLGFVLAGERIGKLGVAGLLAGMLGVGLVMAGRLEGGADPTAVAMCVLAAFSLAVATRTVRGASAGGNVLMVVGAQMLVGSAALGLVATAVETPQVVIGGALIAAFAYQIFVPGLAATLLWFTLVRRVGAVRAATFHFLNPFFGVTIAAILLDETISALDLFGVSVAAAGIWAVQSSRIRQA